MEEQAHVWHRYDTEYTADSVETCPGLPLIAVGLYQLRDAPEATPGDDTPKQRLGRVQLWELLKDEDDSLSLTQRHSLDCRAVLDMKWQPRSQRLAVATADGFIELYQLERDESSLESASLSRTESIQVCQDELALSLDWNSKVKHDQPESLITVSDQKGCVSVVQLRPDGSLSVQNAWQAHDFPAWITAFNYYDDNMVYSGGDDCKFKIWDRRQQAPTRANSRHEMGVCSIQHSLSEEHIVATGSYDEHIRLWDCRRIKSPVSECHVEGGVWRLKWNEQDPTLMCAATMHSGYRVLKMEDNQELSVTCALDSEGELGYGIDWLQLGTEQRALASCSFYNHELQLWSVK